MNSLKEICAECGAKCCRQTMFPKKDANRKIIEYHEARATSETEDYWILSQPCPHIKDNHECDIYENRPQICRDFPASNVRWDWENFCAFITPVKKKVGLRVL